MALRELLAVFDVDTSQASLALRGMETALLSAKDGLGGLAQAFLGSAMVKGLGDFVQGQIDAAKEVRLTAQKLGVGTEELQEFQFAASAAGVSAEGAANGLKFLNKNVGLALENNQEAVDTFRKLDVAIKNADGSVRETGDMLPEIADAFAKMGSQQERTAQAMKLFGRQGADLLPLLQGGSKNIAELTKRFHDLGGGMSEEFIAKAKDAGKALAATKFGIAALKRTIAFELFPVVTAFATRAQGWIVWLQRVTRETNLAKYAAGLLGAGVAMGAIKAALAMGQLFGVIKKGSSIFQAALSLGYFALIVAAVVGLALVFEDLWTAVEGGDSLIVDLITEFFGVEEANKFVEELRIAFASLGATLSELMPDVKGISADLLKIGIQVLPYLVAGVEDVVRVMLTGLSVTISWVKALSALGSAIASGDFSDLGDKIGTAMAKSGDQINGIWKNGSAIVNRAGQPSQTAAAGVPDSYFGGRGGLGGGIGTVQQSNNTTIIQNGIKDPADAGKAAKQGVTDAMGGTLQDAHAAIYTGG